MRYKIAKFEDFSDGEQCEILEPTEKSFEVSENLVIEKNKVKLGFKIKGDALVDSGLLSNSYNVRVSFLYSNYIYNMSTDENNILIKRCRMSTGVYSTIVTLPDSGNEPMCLIKFKGLAIASYINNAESAYLCKYSTDGMTMANWSDTNLIAIAGTSIYIQDYKIVHDRLYILCSDSKIYYTDDGITFILLVALTSSYVYHCLEYLSGYLYIVNNTNKSVYGLVRISLAGDIQDEIISFNIAYNLACRVFAGNLYILVDYHLLFRIEGSNFIPIYRFEGITRFVFSSDYSNLIPIFDHTNNILYLMNTYEKFTTPYKYLSPVVAFHFYYNSEAFALCSSGGNAKVAIYEGNYTSPGNLQTKIYKFPKGLAIPKQIILNHKPLTANAWVKVYVKYDQASSWGSAVIDSNALNAVRKVYDVPTGVKCSFIQFKIEYGTTDDTETPEDATIDLIYLPVGLSNSE